MSAEDYLEYLDGLDLTKEEKLKIINHVILISGRLFDVKTS
tara:strand:- start:232 stop:354 length:123 start_codon:yes stop_codon:yes gene_type:complete